MKRMILPLLTAAAMLTAAGAYAAQTSGDIKSMDTKARTVTLANGRTFHLPESYDMGKLNTSEKVKVTYHNRHGRHMATSIAPQ